MRAENVSPLLRYIARIPLDSRRPHNAAPSGSFDAVATCTRSSTAALVVGLAVRLELLAQVAQEAARERAVDEAMVVRQCQVHDRPDRDHVLAPLVLHDPRALDDGVCAEDPGLR